MISKHKKIIFMLLIVSFSFIICGEAKANIFKTLSDKTIDFAIGLRNIAYAISGFGIIMFTFLAISGKINFKHLGYISLSLFFLAGTGALIDYITKDSEKASSLSAEFGDTYKSAVCQSDLCK
jgi:hypothetical protein